MAAKNEKLLDRFFMDRQRGHDYRQLFSGNWRNYMEGYMNRRSRPAIPNEYFKVRTRPADEFRLVETMLPQHVLAMHRSPDWLSVTTTDGPGVFYEQLTKNLLLSGWNSAKLTPKSIEFLKYLLIVGHAAMKLVWEVQVGEREVVVAEPGVSYDGERLPDNLLRATQEHETFVGPQGYLVDLMKLVLDPTGNDAWAMHLKNQKTMELMLYQQDYYRGALYDNAELMKLKQDMAAKPRGRYTPGSHNIGHQTSPIDTRSLTDYVRGIPEQRTSDTPDIWEWWTWIPPASWKYDDGQWRMIEIANDKYILRDIPAPTPDRRHPFIHTKGIPIPGRVYGESVLYWAQGLIDLKAFLEDARREEVIQKLWQPMLVDENSTLSPESLFRRPGGMLFVGNHTGDIRNTVVPIPQQDVMYSSYNEPAIKDDQINRISGATDPFQGAPAGGRATATEISIISQLGSARFQLATMYYDETFKKPLLEHMFKLYQSRLTQPQLIEIYGNPRQRYPVDLRDLAWDIDVKVDTGFYGSLNQAELQNLQQLYSIFGSNPMAGRYINHGSLAYDMFVKAGDQHASRHIRDEETVQNEMAMEQRQLQQQQQQQFEGQQVIDANRELARGFASTIGQGGA